MLSQCPRQKRSLLWCEHLQREVRLVPWSQRERGQLKAADLRGKTVRQMSHSELHRLVRDGRGNMPPYSDQLSSERIDQVVKYVRTLGEIPKK